MIAAGGTFNYANLSLAFKYFLLKPNACEEAAITIDLPTNFRLIYQLICTDISKCNIINLKLVDSTNIA